MPVAPLPAQHVWYRLADRAWERPLDASWSEAAGGRWNEPGGAATLYLNGDEATARANLIRFLSPTPLTPEDLDDDGGFVLVDVALPEGQQVLDLRDSAGLAEVGMPVGYPLDEAGVEVPHARCQQIGKGAYENDLDGVWCRSAAGAIAARLTELAWFTRSRAAVELQVRSFTAWYYPPS